MFLVYEVFDVLGDYSWVLVFLFILEYRSCREWEGFYVLEEAG